MRRVQLGAPITDFGQRKPISFDALFSSDSESDSDSAPAPAPTSSSLPEVTSSAPAKPKSNRVFNITPVNISDVKAIFKNTTERPTSPNCLPYDKTDDPISTWTQKVTESFERASEKKVDGFPTLTPDFKESLGRLSFFRRG
jgi:hypothetical protein